MYDRYTLEKNNMDVGYAESITVQACITAERCCSHYAALFNFQPQKNQEFFVESPPLLVAAHADDCTKSVTVGDLAYLYYFCN